MADSHAVTEWHLSRRAQVSQGEIAYDVFGAGPPIVLVHGTPSWSYLWRNVVPVLARHATVYLFDLLGYGDSERREGNDISITAQARLLGELLDYWRVDTPAIAGHDIGGAIVLRTHLIEQRAFRCIALLDAVVFSPWITPTTRHQLAHLEAYATMPVHIYEQVAAAHLRTAVYRPMAADTLAAYMAQWHGPSGQKAWYNKLIHFREEQTAEFEPLLGTIGVPVLVVWGERDAWLDPALAERLQRVIPQAEVRLLPEAGHFVMDDAPEKVAHLLATFLAQDEALA